VTLRLRRPLVALYCENERLNGRVRRALCRDVLVLQAKSMKELEQFLNDSSCTVLVPRAGSVASPVPYVSHNSHPIVIVRDKDPGELRSGGKWLGEAVVARDLEKKLAPAVSRACTMSLLEDMATTVETDERLSPILRTAIAFVYRAQPPICSVKELATHLGCHTRTLERHWHEAVRPERHFRVHDLLGWVLLMHATSERLNARSWRAVAMHLGIGSQTLSRLGRSLADRSLREIAVLGHRAVTPLFTDRVRALGI